MYIFGIKSNILIMEKFQTQKQYKILQILLRFTIDLFVGNCTRTIP